MEKKSNVIPLRPKIQTHQVAKPEKYQMRFETVELPLTYDDGRVSYRMTLQKSVGTERFPFLRRVAEVLMPEKFWNFVAASRTQVLYLGIQHGFFRKSILLAFQSEGFRAGTICGMANHFSMVNVKVYGKNP